MDQTQEINGTITRELKKFSDYYSVYQEVFEKFYASLNESFKNSDFKFGEAVLGEKVLGKANIQFCSNKYQLRLIFDPSKLREASICLFKEVEDETNKIKTHEIGKVMIDEYGSISMTGFRPLSKNDSSFNSVVLFFLNCIKEKREEPQTGE